MVLKIEVPIAQHINSQENVEMEEIAKDRLMKLDTKTKQMVQDELNAKIVEYDNLADKIENLKNSFE